MSEDLQEGIEVLEQHVKELDVILAQATKDLNTMAGSERVAKWKQRMVPLIAQHVGSGEAQRLADTRPGPSFTNDLLEEFSDEVDLYRSRVMGLIKELKKRASSPPK